MIFQQKIKVHIILALTAPAQSIGFHRQTVVPVVDILLADDAPQFKKIIAEPALCRVHEGRHYNRLNPVCINDRVPKKFSNIIEQMKEEIFSYSLP